MANYRKILELLLEGRSYNEVVEAVGCSRRDVSVVKKTITARGITAASAESMTDADVQVLFPDGRKRVSDEYESPDFTAVLRSMKANRHFTLQQAWRKYVGAGGPAKKYGYSQYCHLFGEHLRVNDLVATLRHEPGRAMLVDWAGDTVNVIDAITGEVTRAFLFVAVLPFSGALFCFASTNMKSEAWLDAHLRAFSFFGGVTQIIVPDNPTTVTYRRQQGDAERVVNARYQQLADHYGTAIVPARVRKPRDKAAVESAVNVVNKRVIGYLAEDVWTSLGDLNAEIAVRVREINEDIRRANDTTRWELFQAEEAARLGSLPADRFEEVDWKELKVGRNYHLSCDFQYYSVPHAFAGTLLRVRLTSSRVTVFDGQDIVCEHPRQRGRKGQYSTLSEHVPVQHRDVDGLWSRRWFLDRARSFGPATVTVIEQILDRQRIEAQGYLDCQNILEGLGKRNRARLEAACQALINQHGHPTYTTLKRVMAAIDSDSKRPRPVTPAASTRKPARTVTFQDVYVRDASHYARDEEGK
ncbi:IS21 family transposase [Cryobacterium sp. 5B3]|uniref:IS21 family transposase n=1 Tax=Cryobacterium sp. 5B3 TaxID=3048586 RepID=UPI002AB575CB|nr:IS21 family transposase [Cryobacterium sp. 5B3]MDY7540796.1 IS21 family transposase [Cryobacterium sp. 5B3]MDY7541757.1 IS21 family transposase [Cryobacterium sp. 5B3]MDY7542185.1 IS21 family transposase [Cryobacterium sp. 5B3]MEB0276782.1 IS21 family transposase [Cryobacterium sp. 5B3]